ncbi:hypothetical protein NADFUDRAFT_48872 [Nadsonia fulvescens var. elongata DSM 6958]|uniref:Uncharacterized protein n=1 Tax=Nadsonia fulvescens var. elongata DSM 6958 TaxID=857566 RepID=A0A1E3PS19_9ASCO|nr:hypothetical protein NADFUDRAFT_48872 [Nadsonia fulvescens var. elongata DSM 6958]
MLAKRKQHIIYVACLVAVLFLLVIYSPRSSFDQYQYDESKIGQGLKQSGPFDAPDPFPHGKPDVRNFNEDKKVEKEGKVDDGSANIEEVPIIATQGLSDLPVVGASKTQKAL